MCPSKLKFPKPRQFKTSRRQREEATKGKAFRDAVWGRTASTLAGWVEVSSCERCLVYLLRTSGHGHVHHLRGRNVAPEDRYNPDAAVLLCATCHRAVHDGKQKV